MLRLIDLLNGTATEVRGRCSWLIPTRRGSVHHYLLAATLMALALWLRLGIAPVEAGLQYLTFFPAVALSAVAGGLLPGLFATLIGILFATCIFTPPYYAFSLQVLQASLWSNLVFLMDGIIVSSSVEMMHRYRQQYAQKLQQSAKVQAMLEEKTRLLEKNFADTQVLLQRNQALLQHSLEGIHIMDADGNVLEANAAFCSMLGYSREDMLGLNVADWDMRWSREELAMRFRSLIGMCDRFETELRRKDGSAIRVEVVACGVEICGISYVYASARDITERCLAEAQLQRYKLVIESAPDGFWVTDLRGNLLDANEAYAAMSGYTVEELRQMHIGQLEAKECSAEVAMHLERLMQQGYERFESSHRRIDGHEFEVEIAATYSEEMQQIFVFCRDITLRKKAEAELRVAAAAFETHDAIMIADARSNIVRVNRAFTDITGYAPEDVIGKNPRIMSSGMQDHAFYRDMWRQLLNTGSWAGEIYDRRKSGQVYPKWLTITAVRNELRKITHYVAIFSDITVRKQAEEEIRNLAFYDVLTKLPNRRLFMDRFRAALSASSRRNDYGAVLFIDLDRFKTLNDTLGHEYGDLLLIEVAVRTRGCVREVDTVARLGGDEFVVLIEGLGDNIEEGAYRVWQVAEKIRDALSQPYLLKSCEHVSSPSIGVSLYNGHENSVEDLMGQADKAMYQAKSAGRNAVRFFDPLMQRNLAQRAMLESV